MQDLSKVPQIDQIEILELLGRGGMSLVFKARQINLDRIVALKVLSKDMLDGAEAFQRFQQEAKICSSLDHPNIAKTLAFGVSNDGQAYLVMEFLQGQSLAEELKESHRLQLSKFKDIILPVLAALDHAHKLGLVHRDIKPGNIMLCHSDAGNEIVKLVDFGIAKEIASSEALSQHLTSTGMLLGSPMYMSPEQCAGKPLDGRSDIYSLSCVIYETLCGEPPFSGATSLELMHKHSSKPPPTGSELCRKVEISRQLANLACWGLAKDPLSRPQSAGDLAIALNSVLEKTSLDKAPQARILTLARSNPIALIVFLLALTGLVTVLFVDIAAKKSNELAKPEISHQEHLKPVNKIGQLKAIKQRIDLLLNVSTSGKEQTRGLSEVESELNQMILAIARSKSLKDQAVRFQADMALSEIYTREGLTEKNRTTLEDAIKSMTANGRTLLPASYCHQNLAEIDLGDGHYDLAEKHLQTAIRLRSTAADPLNQRILAILPSEYYEAYDTDWSLKADQAKVASKQHRYKDAISLYKTALAGFSKGDKYGNRRIYTSCDLADTRFEAYGESARQESLSQSIRDLDQARKDQQVKEHSFSFFCAIFGGHYLHIGMPDKAIELFEKSLDAFHVTDPAFWQSESYYIQLRDLYVKKGQPDKAQKVEAVLKQIDRNKPSIEQMR